MPEAERLAIGEGEYRLQGSDALRAWMHDRKRDDLGDQTTTAADAVGRPIGAAHGISDDSSSLTRRPPSQAWNLRRGATFPWMKATSLGSLNDLIIGVGVRPSTRGTSVPRNDLAPGRPPVGRAAKRRWHR